MSGLESSLWISDSFDPLCSLRTSFSIYDLKIEFIARTRRRRSGGTQPKFPGKIIAGGSGQRIFVSEDLPIALTYGPISVRSVWWQRAAPARCLQRLREFPPRR